MNQGTRQRKPGNRTTDRLVTQLHAVAAHNTVYVAAINKMEIQLRVLVVASIQPAACAESVCVHPMQARCPTAPCVTCVSSPLTAATASFALSLANAIVCVSFCGSILQDGSREPMLRQKTLLYTTSARIQCNLKSLSSSPPSKDLHVTSSERVRAHVLIDWSRAPQRDHVRYYDGEVEEGVACDLAGGVPPVSL
jgi:hypothetical protein